MQADASGRSTVEIEGRIILCQGVTFAEIREPAVDVGTPGADGGRRHEIIAFPNFWGKSFIIGVRTILFRGKRRGVD